MQNNYLALIRAILLIVVISICLPLIGLCHFFERKEKLKIHQAMNMLIIFIMNIKIKIKGEIAKDQPVLFVSNHSSYLDILILSRIIKKSFISKDEVKSWPVIGQAAIFNDTVFVDRSVSKTAANIQAIKEHFAKFGGLVLFAEGTTSNGNRVLPFKSSMFTLLEEDLGQKNLKVQPLSVVYTRVNNLPMGMHTRPYFAWYGEMSLLPHLWRILKFYSFTAELEFYPPVLASDFKNRKDAAEYCYTKISHSVGSALTGRRVEA